MGKRLQKFKKRLNFNWYRKQSRNTKLAISLGAILILVAFLSFLFTRSNEPVEVVEEPQEIVEIETADEMLVTVTLIEGTLEYRTTDADWQIAEVDQTIEAGTLLRTVGAISRAVLALEDQSEVRMDANSSIELMSTTTSRVIVKHSDGYVYNRIIENPDRDYIVETENAQFEAVGTAFRTISTGDEEAVEVYQGQVNEVKSNNTVNSGEKLVIELDGQDIRSKVEDLDVKDLKDDEFIEWNKELDSENDLFKNSLGFLSDFDGPSLNITDPKPSSTVNVPEGETPKVKFKGSTEQGTKLTVQSKSVSGSKQVDVNVDDNGSFETPELTGAFGNSVFEFIATDRRGNETKQNVTITFSRQTGTQEQGIVLTGSSNANNIISLQWGLVGLTTPDGVRVVYSNTSSTPAYPNDDFLPISSGDSITIDPSSGDNTISDSEQSTYTFRVCRYIAATDSCDQYSNAVSIEIVPVDPGPDPSE